MSSALPPDLVPCGQTREFTESTMPAALLAEHDLRAGRWGVLRVLAGRVQFVELPSGDAREVAAPGTVTIAPQAKHKLRLCGPLRCRIDFYEAPDESSTRPGGATL